MKSYYLVNITNKIYNVKLGIENGVQYKVDYTIIIIVSNIERYALNGKVIDQSKCNERKRLSVSQ